MMQKYLIPFSLIVLGFACSDAEETEDESADSTVTKLDSFIPAVRYDAGDDPIIHRRDAEVVRQDAEAVALDAEIDLDSETMGEEGGVSGDAGSEEDAEVQHCDGAHQIWNETMGRCVCKTGWIFAENECQDVNECASLNDCSFDHGICINDEGGYHCKCENFWELDESELNCVDIDECALNDALCGSNGTCRNIAVSNPRSAEIGYTCDCKEGYTLNAKGDGCQNIDECEAGTHQCGNIACVDQEGSYTCDCGNGTYENGTCHCNDGWKFVEKLGACTPIENFVEIPESAATCPENSESPDASCFLMGSTAQGTTAPLHHVVMKSFFMSTYEVTNEEYQACVDANACTAAHYSDSTCTCTDGNKADFKGAKQPVVCVTWQQALEFANWADVRLPTEAEWEFAARSKANNAYPWGSDEPSCSYAVMREGTSFGCGDNATQNVGSKPSGKTATGLYDMAGNAAEWVQDNYTFNYQTQANPYSNYSTAGAAYTTSATDSHVYRGGSWSASKATGLLRSTDRQEGTAGSSDCTIGFRVVRDKN